MKKSGNNDVAPTLTTKPKTVVLAKKKRKTAFSVDAQEGSGSPRTSKKADEKTDFDALVGRIQATSDALQQDALVVINRSVTTRAWLTGYYIVEYEQHGADRAKYGEGLLKKLAQRLSGSAFALASLKNYRKFYLTYPELCEPVAGYLISRFGKSQSLISQLAIDVGEAASKGQSAISLSGNYKDIAQLSLYISYYRKNKMTAGDNPPIGILLCTGVGKETAEYLAPFTDPQLFLSEYQLQLPTKEKFTEFLKKENEGLQASTGKKGRESKRVK